MKIGLRFWTLAAVVVPVSISASADETRWTVKATMLHDRKAVIATVETAHELPARARITGTITELLVREGDRVTAGERIGFVADRKLALQVQALDARIQAQQATRDKAAVDLSRATELRRTGTVAQARVDDAKTQLDVAERTLKALKAERAVILQQSAEGAVLAPGSGRVLKVPVTERSVVSAGETVATIGSDGYILRLQLPERHAGIIHAGDEILVGVRGIKGGEPTEDMRSGRVTLVYPRIDQGRVVADVEVKGLGDYFVGERTRVFVSAGTRRALVVPPEFIYRRFGVSYARLADGSEVVVQVGALTEKGLEILSGLREGDELVKR